MSNPNWRNSEPESILVKPCPLLELFQLQYIYKGIINDIVESFIKVYTTFEAKDTVYKNAAENS